MEKHYPDRIDGNLRKSALRIPQAVYQCSGIMVFGRRIKSFAFTTDLAIVRNINADAILAVYPFTPQPIINQALLMVADIPVFVGVGGGLTQGSRVVQLAAFAEMQGAACTMRRWTRGAWFLKQECGLPHCFMRKARNGLPLRAMIQRR